MSQKSFMLPVSDSIGSVSAEWITPPAMKAMMTLAHGAGADMNHRFMQDLAMALSELKIGTFRFNFPYIEKKKKIPDPPAIAEKTVQAAIVKMRESFPDIPLFAGGKSFGGRMTSQYLSKHHPEFLKGLIFYGFPLHAPGKPSIDRAAHLSDVQIPMLFLQGTRDALAKSQLISEVTKKLSHVRLVLLDGADHSFKAGKNELTPVLASRTSDWIQSL